MALQNLEKLRDLFINELNSLYPREEIQIFFYLLTEEFIGLKKFETALELRKEISETALKKYKEALIDLKKEVPIQYILGKTFFYGLDFKMNSTVLIPRPETEELVDWIVGSANKKPLKILDIGTGSGCIAIALAKNLSKSEVYAIDISKSALNTARENAELNGVNVNFLEADILKTVNIEEHFDIIVSNPPYVLVSEKALMKKNVLEYEPHKALFVENNDPLLFYERITKFAVRNLKEGGLLFFEINESKGKETQQLLKNNGFRNVELKQDFLGKDRMIKAVLKRI